MSNDFTDLILTHLEKLNIVKFKIENNEKYIYITDEFKELVNKGLKISDIKTTSDSLISAIILAYLYRLNGVSYNYELHQVANVIYVIYQKTL